MQAMPLDEGKTVDLAVLLLRRAVAIDLDDVKRAAGQILGGIPGVLVPAAQALRDILRHLVGGLTGRHTRLAADAKRRVVEHADRLGRYLLWRPCDGGRRLGGHGRRRGGETGAPQEIPAVDLG